MSDSINEDEGVRNGSDEEKKKEEPPIIGKWKLIVLLASHLLMLQINIPLMLFGILHSRILIDKEVATTTISWMINLNMFIWFTSSIFSGPLCKLFSYRKVAVASGLVLALSVFVSGFLNEAPLLFLTFSLIGGMCGGFIMSTCNFIIPLYFYKNRGLAMGFTYLGFSTSAFLGPFILFHLQESFGKRLATFLFGTLLLNTCVCAFTFHPVKWHTKSLCNIACKEKASNIKCESQETSQHSNHDKKIKSNTQDIQVTDTDTKRSEFSSQVKAMLKDTWLGIKALKSMRVLIICLTHSIYLACQTNFLTFLPFVFQERGYSNSEIQGYLLTYGLSNGIVRVLFSLTVDYLSINTKWYNIGGLLCLSIAMIGFTLFKTSSAVFLCIALEGISTMAISALTLIIIEYMGMEYLTYAWSSLGLIEGFAMIILGPNVGLLRDLTGNYDVCIVFLATLTIFALLLWILMPYAVRRDARKGILCPER